MEDGFSSVMFDGSHYPIEENVEKTKEIIRIATEKGISVEAEVGAIGGEEDGVVGGGEVADPDECKRIADLGVTMLAAGIGNIHGVYPENWQGLNFEVLEKIQEKTGTMPLVLHGGTGIPAEMVMPDREMPGRVPSAWAQPTRRASSTVAVRSVFRPRAIRSEKNRMKPVASRAKETKVTLDMAPSTRSLIGSTTNRGRVATMMSSTSRRAGGSFSRPRRPLEARSRMPRKNSRIMSMMSCQ